MPSRIAEYRFRTSAMGSNIRIWKGRRRDTPTVRTRDLLVFSIGAFHRSSPVSLRIFLALFRSTTGSEEVSSASTGSYSCHVPPGGGGQVDQLTIRFRHSDHEC